MLQLLDLARESKRGVRRREARILVVQDDSASPDLMLGVGQRFGRFADSGADDQSMKPDHQPSVLNRMPEEAPIPTVEQVARR